MKTNLRVGKGENALNTNRHGYLQEIKCNILV